MEDKDKAQEEPKDFGDEPEATRIVDFAIGDTVVFQAVLEAVRMSERTGVYITSFDVCTVVEKLTQQCHGGMQVLYKLAERGPNQYPGLALAPYGEMVNELERLKVKEALELERMKVMIDSIMTQMADLKMSMPEEIASLTTRMDKLEAEDKG